MVELYRETVWPYLYTRLPDQDEADRWRGEIEIARLTPRDRRCPAILRGASGGAARPAANSGSVSV